MELKERIPRPGGQVLQFKDPDADIHKYEDYTSFLDQAQRTDFNSRAGNVRSVSSRNKGDYDFNQFPNWDTCLESAKTGWSEGLEKIRESVEAVGFSGHGGLVYEYDVEGVMFDMGRVMEGHPECWMQEQIDPSATGTKVARIFVNMSFSAGVSKENIFRRGAAIVSIVDALESRGVRCEIWAGHYVRTGERLLGEAIRVKASEDALNMEKIAFQCANADMLRRIMFAYQETDPTMARWFPYSGYGQPVGIFNKAISEALKLSGIGVDDFDFVFDSDSGQFARYATIESTREDIRKQLKSFGIDVEFDK